MDFPALNQKLLASGLIRRWFPNAMKNGREYRVGNLQGERGGSLSIRETGQWFDHATSEGGGDLISLYAAMKGISQGKAARELQGDMPETIRAAPAQPRIKDEQEQKQRIKRAISIWEESQPIQGTPAEKYLHNRGLTYSPDMPLRYIPNTKFRDFKGPAMVALMTDINTNEPCGIHRTFLKPDGTKADIEPCKAMLGRAKSALVKLTPDDEVTNGLGIVEGIENGLTILGLGWGPVWAALSANGIKDFPVLDGIECLTIFADHDKTGLEAARQCARRWRAAGKEVRIRAPQIAEADFNDVVRAYA